MKNLMLKELILGLTKGLEITPHVAQTMANYLKEKTYTEYKAMDESLKATGYTVSQVFNAMQDNTSDESMIRTFRDTSSLSAKVDIIIHSSELSDIDKLRELDIVFEQEREKEKAAVSAAKAKRRQYIGGVAAMAGAICAGASVVFRKQTLPVIAKSTMPVIGLISKLPHK